MQAVYAGNGAIGILKASGEGGCGRVFQPRWHLPMIPFRNTLALFCTEEKQNGLNFPASWVQKNSDMIW